MHFSAKRGIGIACRLFVRPSVCDCDVGGSSDRLEILDFARKIIPTPSLFVAQGPSTHSQRNVGKF